MDFLPKNASVQAVKENAEVKQKVLKPEKHAQNGCFQKLWYPQIVNFNRGFHYKPSILGCPCLWKHPNNKSTWNLRAYLTPKSDGFSSRFLLFFSPACLLRVGWGGGTQAIARYT